MSLTPSHTGLSKVNVASELASGNLESALHELELNPEISHEIDFTNAEVLATIGTLKNFSPTLTTLVNKDDPDGVYQLLKLNDIISIASLHIDHQNYRYARLLIENSNLIPSKKLKASEKALRSGNRDLFGRIKDLPLSSVNTEIKEALRSGNYLLARMILDVVVNRHEELTDTQKTKNHTALLSKMLTNAENMRFEVVEKLIFEFTPEIESDAMAQAEQEIMAAYGAESLKDLAEDLSISTDEDFALEIAEMLEEGNIANAWYLLQVRKNNDDLLRRAEQEATSQEFEEEASPVEATEEVMPVETEAEEPTPETSPEVTADEAATGVESLSLEEGRAQALTLLNKGHLGHAIATLTSMNIEPNGSADEIAHLAGQVSSWKNNDAFQESLNSTLTPLLESGDLGLAKSVALAVLRKRVDYCFEHLMPADPLERRLENFGFLASSFPVDQSAEMLEREEIAAIYKEFSENMAPGTPRYMPLVDFYLHCLNTGQYSLLSQYLANQEDTRFRRDDLFPHELVFSSKGRDLSLPDVVIAERPQEAVAEPEAVAAPEPVEASVVEAEPEVVTPEPVVETPKVQEPNPAETKEATVDLLEEGNPEFIDGFVEEVNAQRLNGHVAPYPVDHYEWQVRATSSENNESRAARRRRLHRRNYEILMEIFDSRPARIQRLYERNYIEGNRLTAKENVDLENYLLEERKSLTTEEISALASRYSILEEQEDLEKSLASLEEELRREGSLESNQLSFLFNSNLGKNERELMERIQAATPRTSPHLHEWAQQRIFSHRLGNNPDDMGRKLEGYWGSFQYAQREILAYRYAALDLKSKRKNHDPSSADRAGSKHYAPGGFHAEMRNFAVNHPLEAAHFLAARCEELCRSEEDTFSYVTEIVMADVLKNLKGLHGTVFPIAELSAAEDDYFFGFDIIAQNQHGDWVGVDATTASDPGVIERKTKKNGTIVFSPTLDKYTGEEGTPITRSVLVLNRGYMYEFCRLWVEAIERTGESPDPRQIHVQARQAYGRSHLYRAALGELTDNDALNSSPWGQLLQ